MGWLEELDIDSDELVEGLVLLLVLLLVVIVLCLLCCLLKRRMEEQRKREEKVEEASSFFSFHQAVPPTSSKSSSLFPQVPSAFFKSSGFSLPADDTQQPGRPYVTGSETAAAQQGGRDGGWGGAPRNTSPVLLGSNQLVTTPIFPPSYFASAPYGSLCSAEPYSAPSPPSPPPPYLK